MKRYVLLAMLVSSVYAEDIIKDTQKSILQNTLHKSLKESNIKKDSWINPLGIEATTSKSKAVGNKDSLSSNKVGINLEQEIFKSGAILSTIEKGKNLEKLSRVNYKKQKSILLSSIYGYVISLNTLDLKYKRAKLLIDNKDIEISKKLDYYNNGLIDISELDESVIELSELKNGIEDLKIEKAKLIKELKRLSSKEYKDISLLSLSNISASRYLNNNHNIESKKLELEDIKLDESITASSYLPKLSLYGTYGYDATQEQKNDDYYTYGLKLSIPLDYNSSKAKERAKLNKLIATSQLQDIKEYEQDSYNSANQNLGYIDNKIKNSKTILKRYNSIYSSVKNMYDNALKSKSDVITLQNRIKVVKLDINLLEYEKKSIYNSLFKNID
jgi:outer membrane protein TolC